MTETPLPRQVAMSLLRSAYPAGIVSSLLAELSAGLSAFRQPAAPTAHAPPPAPAEQALDGTEDNLAKTASSGESSASSFQEAEDGITSLCNLLSSRPPPRPAFEAAADRIARAREPSPADFYCSWIAAHVRTGDSRASDQQAGQKLDEAEFARGRAFLAASHGGLRDGRSVPADSAQLLQTLVPEAWGGSRHSSSSIAPAHAVAPSADAAASAQARTTGVQLPLAEQQPAAPCACKGIT